MGQRAKILSQILGFDGWKVVDCWFEAEDGRRWYGAGFMPPPELPLVLAVERRWSPCCSRCGTRCRRLHDRCPLRRWSDLRCVEHPVLIQYAPIRVKCRHCKGSPVEAVPWADPYQRETRRLQHHLALQTASMPIVRVAAQFDLSWSTVRRAENLAIARWEKQRPKVPLRMIGIDEKYLGRRNRREEKFVTIVSNLETGEPIWIGYGRSEATVKLWLDTLSPRQKRNIRLFAMDMHQAFMNAIRNDPLLANKPIVHDPFHIIKRTNQALDEQRRAVFFRAGAQMRAIGRGKRWLFLRAWERCTEEQQADVNHLLGFNRQLALAYQVKEELRGVLKAPGEESMRQGLARILRRTQRKANLPLRKLHDSLVDHMPQILALARYRPPVGRIEALNNNWEVLVRIARGYRDHQYLLRKLRFMTAHPLQTREGVRSFLSLARLAA